jgi:hypothetical protein
MILPDRYAQRVRDRPYGPREITAGGITAWFHGPFAVLTLTCGAAALTVRADLADPTLGAGLLAVFTAAGNGEPACLPSPERLAGEQPITDDVPVTVVRLAVRPVTEGASITLSTTELVMNITLSPGDAGRLAAEIHRWTST